MSAGLVIDLFAGGGGASTGIEAALGRPVDLAINHDAVALAAHRANHPETKHLEASVWEVRPQEVTEGRPVDLLWASPDCTHFSVAKGDVPKSQKIRTLAWVVIRWAKAVRPALICLENVSEFRGWGPLGKDGKPIKARMGETFRAWRRKLERMGYVVDYRILDASHYAAPTRRRRLFLVARCDGLPIVWPDPTHGPGKLPFHTAAECIDWSLLCPSIFERKKPLAEKTMWRIAQGIRRFVLENPRPFIVSTGGPEYAGGPADIEVPLGTVLPSNHRAVVAPHLIKVNHGKRDHRGESIEEPLTTVTATQRGHALVTPVMMTIDQQGSGDRAVTSPGAPLPTTVVKNRHALISPTLIQTGYGERQGQTPRAPGLDKPLGTVVAGGQKHALVAAFLAKHFGGVVGQPVDRPASTITAKDHHGLAAATLLKLRGQCHGSQLELPLPTVTAGGTHLAEVRAFLTTYYSEGSVGQMLDRPLRTVTAKDRLAVVTVHGVDYLIIDIGMRMLQPDELLRAQFGRFAAGYDLSPARTKAGQVRLIGNSVPPEVAEAVVRANWSKPVELAA